MAILFRLRRMIGVLRVVLPKEGHWPAVLVGVRGLVEPFPERGNACHEGMS